MSEIELSSLKDFENSIENGVTLVDFNAPWCSPCQAQEPILDEVQKTFEGEAIFRKIDIDKYRKVALQLGIQSIPTLIVFKDGEEMTRLIGLQDARTLERVLANLLNPIVA